MKKLFLFVLILSSTVFAKSDTLVLGESKLSVNETSKKLQAILSKKGINVFKVIEHSKEAKKVGLKMNETEVVIFGSPKVGTLLMNCSPKFALDLPLKMLIYKNLENKTIVAYENIKNIAKKYDTSKCEKIINKLSKAQGKIFQKLIK